MQYTHVAMLDRTANCIHGYGRTEAEAREDARAWIVDQELTDDAEAYLDELEAIPCTAELAEQGYGAASDFRVHRLRDGREVAVTRGEAAR